MSDLQSKPKLKALVVEDDRAIAEGVVLRLTYAGYDAVAAFDGIQGREMIRSFNPDIVLLDVRMPGKDGLTVLREIRRGQEHPHPPVIMLSASLQDRQTALDAGAQYFLSKPYRSATLLAAIESALTKTSPSQCIALASDG